MLSDSSADDMGDEEALVIVRAAGFSEGEVILYERLGMSEMLLEEYARDGGEGARRKMLALGRKDPELLVEVISRLVGMAAEGRPGQVRDSFVLRIAPSWALASSTLRRTHPPFPLHISKDAYQDESSVDSETDGGPLLRDVGESLLIARERGDIHPVRVLRTLAGESHGRFGSDAGGSGPSVPLSVALDYVGSVLDDSAGAIDRLKVRPRCCRLEATRCQAMTSLSNPFLQSNVEEYSKLCGEMEREIASLLSTSAGGTDSDRAKDRSGGLSDVEIDGMYSHLQRLEEEGDRLAKSSYGPRMSERTEEDFWRELSESDPFETVCFYLASGHMGNI